MAGAEQGRRRGLGSPSACALLAGLHTSAATCAVALVAGASSS